MLPMGFVADGRETNRTRAYGKRSIKEYKINNARFHAM